MTSFELLDRIEQYVKHEQKFIFDTDENNLHNIHIGMGSAFSRIISLIRDIRSDEIREMESIIDGD